MGLRFILAFVKSQTSCRFSHPERIFFPEEHRKKHVRMSVSSFWVCLRVPEVSALAVSHDAPLHLQPGGVKEAIVRVTLRHVAATYDPEWEKLFPLYPECL